MISFRYHLVSIVAVFLALALGIVVGTTALSGPITKDLRNQLDDSKKQRDTLADQVKVLQGRVDDAGQFASTYGAQLVSGTLADRDVLLVELPGTTSSMQSGMTRQVAAAGGKVSGIVSITKNYLDQRLGSGISSLATGQVHPIGLTYPETSDAAKIGAALLAYVLLGKGQKTDLTQVLGGLAALHMVTLDESRVSPSTLLLVLAPGSLSANSYGSNAELDLISALVRSGGRLVVAGDAAAATGGGLVATARENAADRSASSTVDNADTAFGQVSAVLSLAAASAAQFGHYGTEAGADALFPAPSK